MKATTKYMLLKDSLEYYKEQLIMINRQILYIKCKDHIPEEYVVKNQEAVAKLIEQRDKFGNLYEDLESELKRYDL